MTSMPTLRAVPSTVRMADLARRGASPPFRTRPPGIAAPAKPALEYRSCRTSSPPRLDDVDAHAAGGAFDRAHRRLDRVGVEVHQLRLGDLPHLSPRHLADLVLVRHRRGLRDARGALEDR